MAIVSIVLCTADCLQKMRWMEIMVQILPEQIFLCAYMDMIVPPLHCTSYFLAGMCLFFFTFV